MLFIEYANKQLIKIMFMVVYSISYLFVGTTSPYPTFSFFFFFFKKKLNFICKKINF